MQTSDSDESSDLFNLVDDEEVFKVDLFTLTRTAPKSIGTKSFTLIRQYKIKNSKYDVKYKVFYHDEYFADLFVAEHMRGEYQEYPLIGLDVINKALYTTNFPFIIQDVFYKEFNCTLNNLTRIEIAIDSTFNPFERLREYLQTYRLICTCKPKNKTKFRICSGYNTVDELFKAIVELKRDINKETVYIGDDDIKMLKFYQKTQEIFQSGKSHISDKYLTYGFDISDEIYRSEITICRNAFKAHCTTPYGGDTNTDTPIFNLYDLTNQGYLLKLFKHNLKRLFTFRETKYSRVNENQTVDFFDFADIDDSDVNLTINKHTVNKHQRTINPITLKKKVVRVLHEHFLISKNPTEKQLYKDYIENTIKGIEELKQWYESQIYNMRDNIIYTPRKRNNSSLGN